MFRPKFKILLMNQCFPQDKVICLGTQLILIYNCIKDLLSQHLWYGADIEATGKYVNKNNFTSPHLSLIGNDLQFLKYCSEIDQFIWGVFLCIDKKFSNQNIREIELETEDNPFRIINCKGILVEIRTFDTSYFEIYSEQLDLIKRLSEIYSVQIEKLLENKYTWNDSVIIKKEAPKQFHPGKTGVICGMSQIELEETAKKCQCKVGDWIYTIEFADGSDIQVAELYLEKNEC